ncbi:MAG: DNA polymerase III subunit chi [Alphaproteobacteria bacterium]|nr:DNA polymerase III subunit chi [Alphaproteobacteria bacterium]
MTDVGFYHLQRTSLEQALPRLLEKVLDAGGRAVVKAGSDERVEALNAHLWTYGDRAFLPHGSAADGFAERQPVWLTVGDDNPNGANFLVLTDGATAANLERYERCLDLFDGNDPAAVAAARARWRACQEAGHAVTYYQQTEAGGWEKKAEA